MKWSRISGVTHNCVQVQHILDGPECVCVCGFYQNLGKARVRNDYERWLIVITTTKFTVDDIKIFFVFVTLTDVAK